MEQPLIGTLLAGLTACAQDKMQTRTSTEAALQWFMLRELKINTVQFL